MRKRYADCIRDDGDCTICSLVNYGRDCHNEPISRYAAQTRWNAANTTRIGIKLNNNTDADIIKKLDSVPSKMGYIKNLIRDDIKKGKDA